MPTPAELAAAFPVLDTAAYLNAGSCGPTPAVSATAVAEVVRVGLAEGRGLPYFEAMHATGYRYREAWSRLLGAPVREVALTLGASDGIARTLAMTPWEPGDEIVTSDEEHPGLLGPLAALARRSGVTIRVAPWGEVGAAVTPATKLIAVSQVSWLRGAVIDLDALATTGLPILLDGAQAAGAVPVDVAELRQRGVVAFAAAGQKWTCGPVGTGALWLDELWVPDRGIGVWPSYESLEDPANGLDAVAWPDARRFDAPSISLESLTGGLASLELLEGFGWRAVQTAAVERATAVAGALADQGADVLPRGPSTLVAWRLADPQAALDASAAAASVGVLVRNFPGLPYLRASIGAWTTDAHIERLLALPSTQLGPVD